MTELRFLDLGDTPVADVGTVARADRAAGNRFAWNKSDGFFAAGVAGRVRDDNSVESAAAAALRYFAASRGCETLGVCLRVYVRLSITTKRLCRPSSLFSFPGTSFSRSMNRQESSFSGPWSCHDRVDARSGSRTLRAGCAGCLWQSLSRTAHPRCLIAWQGRGNGHSNRTRKHPTGASFPVRSRAMIARPVRSGSTSYDVSRHIYPLH